MKFEKSCGAVVFRKLDGKIEFLTVKSESYGHWGFTKGHVEKGEEELETAKREVLEETGLGITILDKFKTKVEYELQSGTRKEVIYFIGKAKSQNMKIQQEEIRDFRWLICGDLLELLTFENDKKVLMEAVNFLDKQDS